MNTNNLARERFVPWPSVDYWQPRKEKRIDPETGIAVIADWGPECGRGFVSDARFGNGNTQVIKRTSRDKSRKWYRLNNPDQERI